jgi:3-oxoadipate enol-lactonase
MKFNFVEENLEIFYEISGNPDDPKIVLIHGLFVNSDSWRNQLDGLKSEFNILRYDLRGHGRSTKPTTNFLVQNHVDDLKALLTHLNWTKDIYLVGHSLGGMIALQYGIENPSNIKKIVAADTFCFVTKDAVKGVVGDINNNTLESYALLLSERGLRPYNDATAEFISKTVIDHMNKEDLIRATTATEGFNICEKLKSLNLPVLLLVGEKDERTPVQASQMLDNLLPQSELVVIQEAGHLTILDHPKDFNDHLLSFWNK